jgi:hypothetical protein
MMRRLLVIALVVPLLSVSLGCGKSKNEGQPRLEGPVDTRLTPAAPAGVPGAGNAKSKMNAGSQ